MSVDITCPTSFTRGIILDSPSPRTPAYIGIYSYYYFFLAARENATFNPCVYDTIYYTRDGFPSTQTDFMFPSG